MPTLEELQGLDQPSLLALGLKHKDIIDQMWNGRQAAGVADNPYKPGSEEWQFFEDSKPKPEAPGFLATAGNLARDTSNWFLDKARMPDAEAQAQTRSAIANAPATIGNVVKGVWDIPENFAHSIERYRAGGAFEPKPAIDAALLASSGGLLGGTGSEAGTVLTAGMRRRAAPRVWDESIPPPPIGHNMPPEAIATAETMPKIPETPTPLETIAPPETKTWAQGLPKPSPAKRSTEIPNIRELPVDQAIDIARTQPHLIKAGEQSEGYYVGAPREIQSKRALTNQRKAFDEYVAADPRGGDWYDRYRTGTNEVTGGDPVHNEWMSNQEGQWSAGVDPMSEVHFALKENNASIAGMPVKAARPAQHEAHLAALAAKDPNLYQLGDKTGEYARLVNPDQAAPPGGTGVNDFRHARNWGYTEAGGEAQKGALTDAQHRFLDYETALAVDRANRSNLGGRSDWTGEQLQAAPWVRQKALDIQERGGKNEDGSFKLSYEEAFRRANKTIADAFPSKTYNATYEQQPGADVTGHMTGSVDATPLQKLQYFNDPGSRWATAPGGRDAIYSGLGIEGTGNYMRVRPTIEMQGMYRRPDGVLETNPGEVARPLGTFTTATEKGQPFKQATEADTALLNAGEAFRAWHDAQNAGAWHKLWFGGPAKESNSLFYPRGAKSSIADLMSVEKAGLPHGLENTVDTGEGITSTRFYPAPEGGKAFDQAIRKGDFKDLGEPFRARVDSGYIDYVDEWAKGHGSGAATTKMLSYLNRTPEIRDAFNRNPYLAERALAKIGQDKRWTKNWDAPREDIQNARAIVASGPGWVDRLEQALKTGAIALPAVGAILSAAGLAPPREGS
jgi:hypothetical protein